MYAGLEVGMYAGLEVGKKKCQCGTLAVSLLSLPLTCLPSRFPPFLVCAFRIVDYVPDPPRESMTSSSVSRQSLADKRFLEYSELKIMLP